MLDNELAHNLYRLTVGEMKVVDDFFNSPNFVDRIMKLNSKQLDELFEFFQDVDPTCELSKLLADE